MYERATTSQMAEVPLVHLAYADYEEQRMKYKKAEDIYKRLIAIMIWYFF